MIKKISLFSLIVIFSLGFLSCVGFMGMKTPEALRGYKFISFEEIVAMEAFPEFYFQEGPAQYLITKQEKKVWKEIKKIKDLKTRSSVQKDFLSWFWKRRDPSPFTPINEFKKQYYWNVIYTQKNFRYEYAFQGYRSDRGKIFLILGAPDWENRTSPGFAQLDLEERSPNLFPSHDKSSEILIWSYQKLEYFVGTPSLVDFSYPAEIYFRKGHVSGWQLVVPVLSRRGDLIFLPITNFMVSVYRTNLERALEFIRETYIIDKESKFFVPLEN